MSAELIDGFIERIGVPRESVVQQAHRLDLSPIMRWQLGQAGLERVSTQTDCTTCV